MIANVEEKKGVALEVKNILKTLMNEDVKENMDMQLDVWCLIFRRFLKTDGKRMLCSDDGMRAKVKQWAHEAVGYPAHPVEKLAKEVNNFLADVEYWGAILEGIDEEQL
jgi:ribosomal protein L22